MSASFLRSLSGTQKDASWYNPFSWFSGDEAPAPQPAPVSDEEWRGVQESWAMEDPYYQAMRDFEDSRNPYIQALNRYEDTGDAGHLQMDGAAGLPAPPPSGFADWNGDGRYLDKAPRSDFDDQGMPIAQGGSASPPAVPRQPAPPAGLSMSNDAYRQAVLSGQNPVSVASSMSRAPSGPRYAPSPYAIDPMAQQAQNVPAAYRSAFGGRPPASPTPDPAAPSNLAGGHATSRYAPYLTGAAAPQAPGGGEGAGYLKSLAAPTPSAGPKLPYNGDANSYPGLAGPTPSAGPKLPQSPQSAYPAGLAASAPKPGPKLPYNGDANSYPGLAGPTPSAGPKLPAQPAARPAASLAGRPSLAPQSGFSADAPASMGGSVSRVGTTAPSQSGVGPGGYSAKRTSHSIRPLNPAGPGSTSSKVDMAPAGGKKGPSLPKLS